MDGANQLPWFFNFGPEAEMDNREQQEYYEAVFRFAYGKPWFKGLYCWDLSLKWDYTFQLENIPLNLSPKDKPVAGVVEHWFR